MMSDVRQSEDATVGTLVRIWTEVLGVEPGPDDTFVELGGDSVAATMCINRIKRAFPGSEEVPVPLLLASETTVGVLARAVEGSAMVRERVSPQEAS